MPVGLSDGSFHEDYTTMVAMSMKPLTRVIINKPDVIVPPDVDSAMVVTPEENRTNRALDDAELDPTTGIGLEVGYRRPLEGPTEPTGALKTELGTPVPDVDWGRLNQPFGEVKSTSKEDTPVVATAAGGVKITEGDVQQATNLAGSFMGTMAGVRAATLPKPAYELATQAEAQGFSADDIFKSTGFFKGADNKWRFEIDDSTAKYFPENLKGGQKLLSDVLSHKELFEAYPELRHVKIREEASLGAGASYDSSINLIKMGPQALKDKGILMHEIQHAIQNIEDFAKGGMPGRVNKDFKLLYERDVNALRPEYLQLQTQEMRGEALSAKEQARLDYLRTVFKKYTEYSSAADKQARANYEALAGEVESSNVQNRVHLTPSERMRFNPVDTELTPREKQFVRKDTSLTTPYVVRHPYDGSPDFHTY